MPDLESQLERCLHAAEAAWPALGAPPHAFVGYLAQRLPIEPGDDSPLCDRARIGDLYLAFACLRGSPAALAAFEAHIFPEITAALRSMEVRASLIEELRQILRVELFVASPERRALVETYGGRGSLRGWLRSVAVRTAMRHLHSEKKVDALEDEALIDLPSPEAGPELAHFRQVYGPELKAAFAEALAGLPERERNVMRQHFLDGLNIDELGLLYGAHRATVARWIARARMQLLADTRAALRRRLGVPESELASVLRLVRSELHQSIQRLLAHK